MCNVTQHLHCISLQNTGRLNTIPGRSALTEVQDQLQVVSGGQRVRALHSDGEGLTSADDQALPINLPGAVSQVVFMTSPIHVNNQTCQDQQRQRFNAQSARSLSSAMMELHLRRNIWTESCLVIASRKINLKMLPLKRGSL